MKTIYLFLLVVVFAEGFFCKNAICNTEQSLVNIKASNNTELIVLPEKGKHKLKVVFLNHSNDTIAFQFVGNVLSGYNKYTSYWDAKIIIQQDNKTLSSDEVKFKDIFLPLTMPILRVIPPQSEYIINLGYIGNLVKDFELSEDKPFFIHAQMCFSQKEDLTSRSLWYLRNHPKTFLRTDTISTPTIKYLNTAINLFGIRIDLDGIPKVLILFYRDILKLEKHSDIIMLMLGATILVFGIYLIRSQKKYLWKLVGIFLSVLTALLIVDILIFIFYGY
ncbi:MAG: hypothetical protein HYZ54_07380 [Ignavibacteriae bacterium]|nr:hypothetical protein [Ignavibacteriota bacterium]